MQLIQGPALSALAQARGTSRITVQPQPEPAASSSGNAGRIVFDKVDLSAAAKKMLDSEGDGDGTRTGGT